ncbi:MAG: bifunctional diguanylate cyclase/phosphodiesterase [Asticcacaulis sp.]|uniref:putative bifunctional diguanylate cyclase/phosphodiesterase n=1 Tax=Asticcacaulis sp. TaxID=1872648 RepID=UPI0039E3F503
MDSKTKIPSDWLDDALAGADSLLWAYDLSCGCLEFHGSLTDVALPSVCTPDELAPLLASGEADRLAQVLHTLEVRAAVNLPGEDQVQCLVRLKDQRLLYFKGRRTSAALVLGVVTEMSRDLRRAPKTDGLIQDIHIDPLTGLYNRRGFLAASRDLLAQEGDYDLVVGDLNRFRRLNEALGHDRADMVLGILAQRLREAFGNGSVLGRLGEDEFAVLTLRGFPRVSERMRKAMERTLVVAGFDIQPSFTMGAVAVEGGEGALESAELLRRAEMAIEAARAKGAGGVAAYRRELESDGLTRLALEAELRKAFISGEIHAWYQPIVNLQTGVIAGFEALARWVHPRRGIIPPDHFLTAARDLGLMSDLGLIMMQSTIRALVKWRTAYSLPPHFFVSVNLSAPEIERQNLVEDVSRLIQEAGLPTKCLKLEVTESDVMRDPDAAARVLEALREAGAGLALDDFGTGFSSLSYLAKLPFDTLKIDRSFIQTLMTDGASEKIVHAILTLGSDFGLDVVAEGVEDQALADRLAGLACHLGQGYGFARPLKPNDAEAFLATSLAQA